MSEMDSRRIRFDGYEADLAAGELRKNGKRLPLQEQPFQILVALLERPGDVVTRGLTLAMELATGPRVISCSTAALPNTTELTGALP